MHKKLFILLFFIIYTAGLTLAVWAEDINGWIQTEDGTMFYSDGIRRVSWMREGENWFFFNTDGIKQTGWVEVRGERYYLRPDGVMVTGVVNIDGIYHGFAESGEWVGRIGGSTIIVTEQTLSIRFVVILIALNAVFVLLFVLAQKRILWKIFQIIKGGFTKKTKLVVNIVIVATLIVYLVFSTTAVIAVVDGNQRLYRTNLIFDELYLTANASSQLWYSVHIYGGWRQQIVLYGFAFARVAPIDGAEREVRAIIVCENNIVRFSDATIGHGSGRYHQLVNAGNRVPSPYIAYYARFSTLGLRDGYYSMYLYIRESPDVLAIRSVPTGRFVINSGNISFAN